MTDARKLLGPLDDAAAPPSERRRRRLLALCSHCFLIVVSVTMLAPFVWMVLTAVKPQGQAMQGNWLPTRDFVLADGRECVVTQRARLKDGAGVYRVRLAASAAGGPREMDVSTDRLIPVGGSGTHFLLTTGEGAATGTASARLVEKLAAGEVRGALPGGRRPGAGHGDGGRDASSSPGSRRSGTTSRRHGRCPACSGARSSTACSSAP